MVFDRVAQMGRKDNHAGAATMWRKRAGARHRSFRPERAENICESTTNISIEYLFHAALPAAVSLNNCSFKGPLEFGRLEGDIPGGGGEITAVAAAAAPLPQCWFNLPDEGVENAAQKTL